MAAKNKVNITSDIVAEIRTGNSDTTALGLRTILYEILDSYANVKDGGLIYETPVGYNGLLTLTDAKSFVYKQWVEDYVSSTVGLPFVLANNNKTGGFDITSDNGNSVASIVDTEIFLYSGTTNAGKLYLSQNEADLYNSNGGFYVSEGTVIVPNYIQLKSDEAIIRHVDKLTISTPITTVNSDTTVNGYFNAISNDGNSSIVVEDGDVYSQWTNGIISSCQNNDANESSLNFYNGSVGFTAFIKAKEFSNDIFHSFKNTFSSPINEFTYGGIYFVSGIGIDTTSTVGTDVLNIGATNANVINYGNASTIHNFLGTAIYELQVNSYVTDKLMTLNYGGSVDSGIGVGFEIEENNAITGYFKTNAARNGFSIQTPAISHTAHLLLDLLSSDKTFSFPDNGGVLAIESYADSKVGDTIVDGVTGVAPSQNAVFDALGLKLTKNYFVDITSICTIVGWASYVTNSIRSVDMGDYYIVTGYVTGTSNSTFATIKLPYTNNGHRQAYCSYGLTNGVSIFTRVILNGASDTIDFRTGEGGNLWVASGTKEIDFCLIVEK